MREFLRNILRKLGLLESAVLGSDEIERLVKEVKLIQPFVPYKVYGTYSWGLEPAGYTFRLAGKLLLHECKEGGMHSEIRFKEINVGEEISVVLPPRSIAICSSMERFNLPPNIVGLLFGKSTFTRQGLLYSFAVVDPGFSGNLTFSITNLSPGNIEVVVGEGIAQIVFLRVGNENHQYQGRYQNSEGIILPY